MRQNIARFVQLLKHWLCDVRLGVVENWAYSVDRWLQALQFSVYINNLLSMCLRCNDLTEIQKAVSLDTADQMGSRRPKSDNNCFLVQIWC